MATVSWSARAIFDLTEIIDYIRYDNPTAATRVAADIVSASFSLETFPHRGRHLDDGRRELVTVRPCIIRYRVTGVAVTIVSVFHAAQDRTNAP